ncbi:hypothetical protein [Geodermatophilus sp. URMC 64]
MTGRAGDGYVEPGGSWRPFWLVAAFLAALIVADVVLPGPDVPAVVWVLAVVAVLGVVAAGVLSARRVWTVRVDADGPDAALSVGRERVPLADVDARHLRAVRDGEAGVDAGAAVLGGGWSLPKGRTGLPLRLAGGRTVLVPTRDPAALTTALLTAVTHPPRSHPFDGSSGSQGTLGT